MVNRPGRATVESYRGAVQQVTAQSISGPRAAEPELCRVSVIGGNTQLDVGLPANVPIAAFIGDLVRLIE
ncbi:EsaB/YukD family protein, partial [Streptomyces sp. NPDC059071]|uniref:EsaB/YukD family protein n=1 Tax=Streptomyces sp. NPDC059071 TaxID=3346714 RepID=UPI00368DC34D